MDLVAIGAQATGFVFWPIVEQKADLWIIPVSTVLISIGWWENYISKHSHIPLIKRLSKVKDQFNESRYFTYMFVSIWKCICFFLAVLFIILFKEGEVGFLFTKFSEGFGAHQITITEVSLIN